MRISRSTGALCGSVLLVLGIWGGIVPFIGPYFHYAFGSTATWHYTVQRLWLDILPGAAVVLGALMVLRAGHRVSGTLGSWLAIIGGAWFVLGPAFSRLWVHGPTPIGGPLYGTTRQWLELIGYFYGLGALIIAIAAFAMGRVVSRPALVLDPVTEAGAADVASAGAAGTPVGPAVASGEARTAPTSSQPTARGEQNTASMAPESPREPTTVSR